MKERHVCLCVLGPPPHPSHKMLCCFKSISFLCPSAAPLPVLPRSRGPAGVFSGVAGAGGGGVRTQVPAVADTGRETDEDGHRALCSGG